ncbi:MAG: patatin-like phospholipase family protein [Parachlamydiaceae bacterium]
MFRLCTLLLCLLAGLSGCCCPQRYNIGTAPPPLPTCLPVPQQVRLALVLGGGGAKGLAHVGVIEELEAAHIPIDLVIGCSAGSIVGALYCDDPSVEELKETLLSMKTSVLVDLDVWNAKYGLCQGRSLRRFLCKNLTARTFEELKKPFFLVTTDLYTSELVTLGGGPLIPAIEASSSIPFVFVPVYLHGRAFVDGGTIDPVPVRTAEYFNPEVIVAVDLRGLLPRTFPTNLFGVATRSAEITLLWQSECCLLGADVVIRPELCQFGTFEEDKNEQIYQAGKDAARKAIPKIIACLKQKAGIQEDVVMRDFESECLLIEGDHPDEE